MSLPVVPSDPSVLRDLREILQAAGYNEQGLRDVFGVTDPEWQGGFFRTIGKSSRELSLSTLATLFLFGAAVERERASTALAPLRLADLEAVGLLAVDGKLAAPDLADAS
jgi:hypothetical protein